eukprot:4264886-Pyramimonas_sp.AAC.1
MPSRWRLRTDRVSEEEDCEGGAPAPRRGRGKRSRLATSSAGRRGLMYRNCSCRREANACPLSRGDPRRRPSSS